MWLIAQRVKEQDVEPLQFSHRRFGDRAEVGQICRRSEAETVDLSLAVDHRYHFKLCAEQVEACVHSVHRYAREPAELVIGVKNVLEDLLDRVCGRAARVERHLALVAIRERAGIVEAEDMIRVRVRVEDRVKPIDVLADRLGAEVRCRIN